MKKNSYFLYSNIDELYRFLVSNMIYPANNQNSSFSLSRPGYIYITKKRFSKAFIFDKCQLGVMTPVILEVIVKTTRDKNMVTVSEDELLLSAPITFNSVVSIYYLDGELPLSLFNDAYLFRSLLNNQEFEYGDDLPSDLSSYKKELEECTNIKWDRIQGFYASRYCAMRSEFKAGKNLMIASNLDDVSALEMLGQNQKDYFSSVFAPSKKYFFKENCSESSEIVSFINSNYETLLSNKKIKSKYKNKELVERLFKACFDYKKGDNLLLLVDQFYANKICDIEHEASGDIFYLNELLFSENNEDLRLMFLLNSIVSKELEEAIDYLSNYNYLSSEEKKCILSMYGLCAGMSRLTILVKKKRPDLLLFSFNRAKKHFDSFVESGVNANDYFKFRDFVTDHLTRDGFNYVAYNREFELTYLKIMCANQIMMLFDLPKRMIGKEIIKFSTAEELHKTYLLAKRRNG